MKERQLNKQFDKEDENNKGLNQEEIDRNSTVKKVELKEAFMKRNTNQLKKEIEEYQNFSNEFSQNGK